MTPDEILIKVYVPDAVMMSYEDAVQLAHTRDQESADALENSVLSGLQLERAARAANAVLDVEFSRHEESVLQAIAREAVILKELGF